MVETELTLKSDVSASQIPLAEPLSTMEEIVTEELVESIVKSANLDLELVKFSSVPGTQAGDNYMSIMYAVTIDVKSKKTGTISTLDVMLKTMPRSAFRQQRINESGAFIKDAKLYNTVFPHFLTFQKEQGLEHEEIYRGYPDCFATLNDGKTDYLAMENLRVKGYKMGARMEGLDFEHCEIVLKNMANFHAISYVKYRGDYDAIMKEYPFLEEKMFLPEDRITDLMKGWMGKIGKIAQIIRDMGYQGEGDLVYSIYKDSTKFWKTLHGLVGSKVSHAVVTHGDCWTNNFLFLYDEETGKPVSMKFVDYQWARAGSRILDLAYFLYTSPETVVLNSRKSELIRVYYHEFVTFSRKLGLSEGLQQSFEEFLAEFDHFQFYGIIMGLTVLPLINASKDSVPDFETFKGDITDTAAVDEFFMDMMKSKATKAKLYNLIKNHCVDVKFIKRD